MSNQRLVLTNSLSGKKESFIPQHNGEVSLYVCGITPYDYAHIGHGRCYVTFDLLLRTLRFLGYKTTYVRNYTDIEDKIINKALIHNISYQDIAAKFIRSYQQDMQALGCLIPDYEPKVTTTIPEIIAFIEGLIGQNKAYVLGNDVYFDITSFPLYGKLSKKNLDDLIMGSRVEVNVAKKSPADFVLWKGNVSQEYWKSPWGYGRPGWHIECSAMAKKYLGESIDIHGGGADLMFPHHENEIAQSEALHNKPFAHYWLHNAFVNINKEKMSKSLGNTITLQDIFKKYDPAILRYFFIQHSYRQPIDFSFELLDHISTAYKKLIIVLGSTAQITLLPSGAHDPIIANMLRALYDDLNSAKLLGLVFQNLDIIKNNSSLLGQVAFIFKNLLGLPLLPIQEEIISLPPQALDLLAQREQARQDKNWPLADKLRDKLLAMGVTLCDKKM